MTAISTAGCKLESCPRHRPSSTGASADKVCKTEDGERLLDFASRRSKEADDHESAGRVAHAIAARRQAHEARVVGLSYLERIPLGVDRFRLKDGDPAETAKMRLAGVAGF